MPPSHLHPTVERMTTTTEALIEYEKSFVSFDKFECECMESGKSLHETMQENCKDRFVPPEEKCSSPCAPYWQSTGGQRC
jgi:hypothetical protein